MTPSSIAPYTARSNGRAIAAMCVGVFFLVLNDAMAKWLTEYYPPLQIIFLRSLLALPMIAAIGLSISGPASFRTRHLKIHVCRGLLMVAGSYGFFTGLKLLPLAEATSLVFSAPIFITAFSVILLGDHVGRHRWSAVIVGFVGVLIIVRPGAAAFQPASLFPVATALLYALAMISARWIDRRETVWTMMFYVVLFPMLFSGLIVPAVWQPLQLPHLPQLFAMALFGTVAMALITEAFRFAPAAVVAPFDYTALIWASAIGWLVWGEIPDSWVYAGAVLIIASGSYIAIREAPGRRPPSV